MTTSHLVSREGAPSERDVPPWTIEPHTIRETGLSVLALTELAAKVMYYRGRLTEGDLSDLLHLSRSVVDEITDAMKRDGLIETTSHAGPLQREFLLTERGRRHAQEAFERDRYVGPAPVPYAQYLASEGEQSVSLIEITPERVRQALGHLVQSEALVARVGAAVLSASTLLLHGPPGNGKSAIAASVREMLGTTIAIPYAVEVSGQTIRLYDPRVHEEVEEEAIAEEAAPVFSRRGRDRRYAVCRRPLVTLASELKLEDLQMGFSAADLTHTAPPQMKANGGVLVVDDLGRQVVRPEDLLNRWMAPMATKVDQLSLRSGEVVRIPFDVILVIGTNLTLEEIGDEAFLRRIRHKVAVTDPTPEEFELIFQRASAELEVPLEVGAVEHVLERYYRATGRPLRGAHPTDILRNIRDFALFEGVEPRGTIAALDRACDSYFG